MLKQVRWALDVSVMPLTLTPIDHIDNNLVPTQIHYNYNSMLSILKKEIKETSPSTSFVFPGFDDFSDMYIKRKQVSWSTLVEVFVIPSRSGL